MLQKGVPRGGRDQNERITSLHKMLDSEITSIGQILNSDEAFNQIENKLRQLEVKLGKIQNQEIIIPQPKVQRASNYEEYDSCSILKGKRLWDSETERNTYSQHIFRKSNKDIEKDDPERKKLNFDQENRKSKSKNKASKQFRQSNHPKVVKKIKSENHIFSHPTIQKVSSKKLIPSSSSKLLSKKDTRSVAKQKKNPLQRESSAKKINRQLSASNKKMRAKDDELAFVQTKFNSLKKILGSSSKTEKMWKDLSPKSKGKDKRNLSETKKKGFTQEIDKRVSETMKRKMALELEVYKRKNDVLERRVRDLKNFQESFMKLKDIFDKGKLRVGPK